MEKISILSLAILFLFLIFVISTIVTPEKNMIKIVYVDNDFSNITNGWGIDHFNVIQNAINKAEYGDIIIVNNGIYYENIWINKTITLIGENKIKTKIYGNNTNQYVFEINNQDRVNISYFTIVGGYGGILINSSNYTNITHNIIINNSLFIKNETNIYEYAGLKLRLSDNNVILNNIIENNNNNILIEGSNNNSIIGNNISKSFNGILITNYSFLYDVYNVSFSQKNLIYKNNISYNDVGINLTYFSYDNIIYLNNMINNFKNAYDEGINTSWDNKNQGNYWHDYNGIDTNNDGIGEIPYYISGGNNKDNFPLIEQYGETKNKSKIILSSVYLMLFIGVLISILFVLPIAYLWYRKRIK